MTQRNPPEESGPEPEEVLADGESPPADPYRDVVLGLMELCREMGHTIRRMDPGGEHVEQWTNDGTEDPSDPRKGEYVPDHRYFDAEDLLHGEAPDGS